MGVVTKYSDSKLTLNKWLHGFEPNKEWCQPKSKTAVNNFSLSIWASDLQIKKSTRQDPEGPQNGSALVPIKDHYQKMFSRKSGIRSVAQW